MFRFLRDFNIGSINYNVVQKKKHQLSSILGFNGLSLEIQSSHEHNDYNPFSQ